jgi:hypothetical protein
VECRLDAAQATVARVADFITALVAFEAPVKRRPGEPILLRQGTRAVLKSIPD